MSFTLLLFSLLGFLFVLRIFMVLISVGRASRKRRPGNNIFTLLVLGSGGHTAEILNLVGALNLVNYWPRAYIAAKTDNMSLQRARTLEEKLASKEDSSKGDSFKDSQSKNDEVQYYQIFRSREVGQSYFTSIGTTLIAIFHAFFLVFQIRPELILCNGPGTCLPICVAGFLLRVLGIKSVRIVYVESVARVQKLSLTGNLLHKMGIVDQFFVQWPKLVDKYPRTQYVGRLM